MKNTDLQALRMMLFLSVSEAVEHIKTHSGRPLSVRSWQHWEKGERSIPSDVFAEMQHLAGVLDYKLYPPDGSDPEPVTYYRTFEEWKEATGGELVINWRLDQALASHQILEKINYE